MDAPTKEQGEKKDCSDLLAKIITQRMKRDLKRKVVEIITGNTWEDVLPISTSTDISPNKESNE